MYSALNGVIATEYKLHPVMFILPTLTFAALQIFVSFSLLFPEYKSLSAVRIPLYSLSSSSVRSYGFTSYGDDVEIV
jgi:hypothetical protein